uniref:MIP12495p n=1 Tax=Drosophila melanogaster TaxID=7227 RepID=C9QP67_DROME|nr:MIP12495p [Drosophila melanogaster]
MGNARASERLGMIFGKISGISSEVVYSAVLMIRQLLLFSWFVCFSILSID